ncbi:hypothetical protein CDAR_113601 [Caerostris darwini]|uniref:Uncharacterized protein n=1 Tax=Caerostris darwini TaxID=1538125 RepID=A0AAV4NM91_9ARAC|nr:hypothetical protein CDAR_113601 [Caerostris darwini]
MRKKVKLISTFMLKKINFLHFSTHLQKLCLHDQNDIIPQAPNPKNILVPRYMRKHKYANTFSKLDTIKILKHNPKNVFVFQILNFSEFLLYNKWKLQQQQQNNKQCGRSKRKRVKEMKITSSSPGRIGIPFSSVKMSHRDRGGRLLTTFLEFTPTPIPDSSRNEVCPSRSSSEDLISLRQRLLTLTNAIRRSRMSVAYLQRFLLFAEFAALSMQC